MRHNFIYRNSSAALVGLLGEIQQNGAEVGSRNGRATELMHVGTTLTNPTEREIITPNRRVNIAAQIAETMWVLSGRDDVKWLAHYLKRAPDYSDDGLVWRGAYGPRLRGWGRDFTLPGDTPGVDQLAEVVRLLRADPMTRRAVMSIFDPARDFGDSKDIPCNCLLMFSNRLGKLDLHVAIRSNDLIWGWSGINSFEWSALQEIVANLVGVGVGQLHFSTTSLHVYDTHLSKARQIIGGGPVMETCDPSPAFETPFATNNTLESFDRIVRAWFVIEAGIRRGDGMDKAVNEFPEPMMQSWLRVLQWWWRGGDRKYLEPIARTRLAYAASAALQPLPSPVPEALWDAAEAKGSSSGPHLSFASGTNMLEYIHNLHVDKHAAYGDSWKRRGEMLGIMANIARKIDRLGKATEDETALDTAIDLLVYLAKYRWWLVHEQGADAPVLVQATYESTDEIFLVDRLLGSLLNNCRSNLGSVASSETYLATRFDALAIRINESRSRTGTVDAMLLRAFSLAMSRWKTKEWKDGNATRFWNPEQS